MAALQVVASIAAVAPQVLIGLIGALLVDGGAVSAEGVAGVVIALAVRAAADASSLAVSH